MMKVVAKRIFKLILLIWGIVEHELYGACSLRAYCTTPYQIIQKVLSLQTRLRFASVISYHMVKAETQLLKMAKTVGTLDISSNCWLCCLVCLSVLSNKTFSHKVTQPLSFELYFNGVLFVHGLNSPVILPVFVITGL